jgi:hypothetical protein
MDYKGVVKSGVLPMSEQELELVLATLRHVRDANTATPQQARSFLQQEGVLTDDGELAEYYNANSDQSTAA